MCSSLIMVMVTFKKNPYNLLYNLIEAFSKEHSNMMTKHVSFPFILF